jgi:hypothetical protein
MTGGDFVRNVKQVIDLLRQLAVVAPTAPTRAAAEAAAHRLLRGVVAASAAVTIGDVDRSEGEAEVEPVAEPEPGATIRVPAEGAS